MEHKWISDEGQLVSCAVCRLPAEGFTSECPEVPLSDAHVEMFRKGVLDYRGGRWWLVIPWQAVAAAG